MANNERVSVKTISIIVGIIIVFGSVVTSLNVTASNAKRAMDVSLKTAESLKETNLSLHEVKNKQARFEGIMEERTSNIQENVIDLRDDMKKLLENLELSDE